jgi:hypothetical protein
MRQTPASLPTPVGSLLTAVLPGLGERLLETRIRREWEDVMGAEIARRSEPRELSDGGLHVIVDNSPWLQELTLREPELRCRLADRYGADAIRSLRFSLGSVSHERAAPAQRSPAEVGELTEAEEEQVKKATAQLTDPALAALVRRVLVKDALARRARGGRK